MRILLLSILLISTAGRAQSWAPFSPSIPKDGPQFFLDSQRVLSIPYFDPEKLEDINVVKQVDSLSGQYGKVYMRSKYPHVFNFLDLPKIAASQHLSPSDCLFMIDNEWVKDLNGVRIDSSYILRCEIMNTREIGYLQNYPPLNILNIRMRTKDNLEKEKIIHLRGESDKVVTGLGAKIQKPD
ncbi:MAG TPA: hypothetical protein VK563_03960 [Puia sp.]|nr:hypothetical protein [Puia sp.]